MVTYDDVAEAARRIEGVAHRTPVMASRTLDGRVGGRLFLKCENFQRMGAFKFRGAYNAVSRLTGEQRACGVLSYSSGNHAQAIALACRIVGTTATIVMPRDAPAAKRRATEGYGARVVEYDPATQDREEVTRGLLGSGAVLIPPFDHEHIIAGQGTAAGELIEDVEGLDVLLVPCGGGGLLSGSAIAARHLTPRCRVIGVEPELADDATRSFRTGTLHTVHHPPTIADGARTASLGKLTFPLVRQHVDEMVTVSEEAILRTLRFLWERTKLVVEPTGALGLAAAYRGKLDVAGKRVGVILSGGNADVVAVADRLRDLPDEAESS